MIYTGGMSTRLVTGVGVFAAGLVACGSPEAPGKSAGTKSAPTESTPGKSAPDGAKAQPDPAARAQAVAERFFTLPASEAADQIQWDLVVRSWPLTVMGNLAAEGKPLPKPSKLGSAAEQEQAVASERADFVATWTPVTGCTLSASNAPPLPSAEHLKAYPPQYQRTSDALDAARHFTARCDGSSEFAMSVDARGKLVRFSDETPVDNRFLKYLNEPEEPDTPEE